MDEIQINLPGGEKTAFTKGTAVGEIIEALGKQGGAVGAKVNGELVDFWHEVEEDATIEPVKAGTEEGLGLIRHTAAHVMAEAVQELFPEARVTIGPVIENGFYYDFDYSRGFTPEDLEKIEAKMKEIVSRKTPLTRKTVSRDEAISTFLRRRGVI